MFPQRVGGGPTPNQDVPVPCPQIGRDPRQKKNYRGTANGENNKRLFESPLNKKEPDCCSADRQQQHTVIEQNLNTEQTNQCGGDDPLPVYAKEQSTDAAKDEHNHRAAQAITANRRTPDEEGRVQTGQCQRNQRNISA